MIKTFKWHSTKTLKNDTTTLDEYMQRMPEEQKDIYFFPHENFDVALDSTYLQIYKKKGWEVLIVEDPMDEPCLQKLRVYNSKPIISIEKTSVKLG